MHSLPAFFWCVAPCHICLSLVTLKLYCYPRSSWFQVVCLDHRGMHNAFAVCKQFKWIALNIWTWNGITLRLAMSVSLEVPLSIEISGVLQRYRRTDSGHIMSARMLHILQVDIECISNWLDINCDYRLVQRFKALGDWLSSGLWSDRQKEPRYTGLHLALPSPTLLLSFVHYLSAQII